MLNSEAIWLCLGCETCSSRCPQQVEPAAVMNAARILALQRHKPAIKEVSIYYQGFVNNMRLNGKIHDASVVAITRLMTGRLFHDLPLGWQLAERGRSSCRHCRCTAAASADCTAAPSPSTVTPIPATDTMKGTRTP